MIAIDTPATARSPQAEAWLDEAATQSLAVSFSAEVTALRDDGRLELRAGRRHWVAQCATSCLVVPEAGDRVACWRTASEADDGPAAGDTVYVLAVLARRAVAPTRLRIAEGVEIHGEAGRMQLTASAALQVHTPSLELQAERATVQAGEVSLVYRALQSIGELASATVGQLRLVGSMLSTVFDQQVHHAGQHLRTVDGVDRLQAEVIQQQAGTLLHLQGENLLANGDRVVKMQGAQIHLG